MSVLKVENISILVLISTVIIVESYYYEDDFSQNRQKIMPRLSAARQLFYQDIPHTSGNSYRPPQQSSYGLRPYQFQYAVRTGVGSGYSRGAGSFSHKEERTPKQVQGNSRRPINFCESYIGDSGISSTY